MSDSLPGRPISIASGIAAALLLVGSLSGCRSNAKEDLYRQKMASEIRVLEDQLYAADYENRVLHDKLERLRSQASDEEPRRRRSSPSTRTEREPIRPRPSTDAGLGSPSDSEPDDQDPLDAPSTVDDLLDDPELQLPDVSPGIPAPLTDPLMDLDPQGENEQRTENEQGTGTEQGTGDGSTGMSLPPAPGGPEPPGRSDTESEGIIPGKILPPPANPEDDKPAGQIELPDSAQAGVGVPTGLRIHRTLSGGHRLDEETDGLMIVVNVVDQVGKTVDVMDFDIEGKLSIVVLDPQREPHEARIGRWDFEGAEVTNLVRSEPISGLHVALPYQDDRPLGKEVIVHVRLRGEEDEMRCEQRISAEQTPAVAKWTPRVSSDSESTR
ncbi:MAG: hypothetical protein AAGG48_31835 [Planctomycetota bacterium]